MHISIYGWCLSTYLTAQCSTDRNFWLVDICIFENSHEQTDKSPFELSVFTRFFPSKSSLRTVSVNKLIPFHTNRHFDKAIELTDAGRRQSRGDIPFLSI